MPASLRFRVSFFFLTLSTLLSAPVSLRAQELISITGVVTDASDGVLPGAAVETISAGRRFASVSTDANGRYRIEAPSGIPIELRIQLAGFAPQLIAIAGRTEPLTRNVVLPVAGLSDTLIVTAARAPESRLSVTESVSAFTRHDIEALGSTSLADVIRFVPGVNVESNGREGQVTSMFSRGGESDYNLVLIDGVRANQSGGIFDFSRINAAEIERVEVVRGAQSALWGSDAMGSVVQIFTRRAGAADAAQVTGSVEAGSFGSVRSDARVTGGARNIVDYHAGASQRRTSGAFDALLPEDDEFSQHAIDAGIGAALGTRAALRASARYTKGRGKSVGQIAYGARDTGTAYDTRDFSGSVSVMHTMSSRLAGSATYNDFRYKSYSADAIADPYSVFAVLTGTPNALFPNGTRLIRLIGAAEFSALAAAGGLPAPGQFLASRQVSDFPFESVSEFERPAFRYQADYTAGAARTTVGYDWEREVNPAVSGFRLDNHAFFVQQHLSFADRWFVTAGGRIDSKDSYDTFASPKLSAGGFLVPYRNGALSSLKVFGNIGKGIKSPTFTERLGGPFSDPAPELKVERARTGDVGVESTFARQRFLARVVYFNNDYLDQVAFRGGLAGDGIPEYINIDGSKADGWELEGALQRPVGGMTVSGSYAYVDHRVVTNVSTSQQFQPGQPLLRRPRHSGTLRASFVRGRLALNADARITGDRHDHSFLSLRTVPNAERPTAVTTDITVNPGYAVFGGGADVRVSTRLTAYARVSNAGDAKYETVLGYPALPRAFAIGARIRVGASR
ncbi:MAG TPA: TonB-dependent receptor [Vicinamibacterales bacterium]|nr:TonB-dependent receptor [Vicinamibacterales bacterium]